MCVTYTLEPPINKRSINEQKKIRVFGNMLNQDRTKAKHRLLNNKKFRLLTAFYLYFYSALAISFLKYIFLNN